jgi:hypothetical protein
MYEVPVPLPPDFADECLYAPDQWYVHELLAVEDERVLARVDTTRLGALVEAQRPIPGHTRHVPGAVMVQITGTLGNLHAVYAMGCRPSQGWVGFGTHVRAARFPSLGVIGPPVEAELRIRRLRRIRERRFVEYAFRYEQEGRLIYESEQAAIWFRGDAGAL